MNYYFHFPFCRSKCGYCAFYSLPAPSEEAIACWLERILRELKEFEPVETCETIYLGGGTPTLPEPRMLERFFEALYDRLRPGPETEISMEANPETLDREKVVLIRAFVNRLSLGVQSFCPEKRETLGRNCSQQKLDEALELVCNADFPHWNCDLIYAIPGQNREAWRQELRRAASCGIDHLSCYNLTPEEGALLSSQLIPDEEDSAAMWEIAETELAAAGIRRYEISNYALHNRRSRHNSAYWDGTPYLGLGPSAHSYDGQRRIFAASDLKGYLAGAGTGTIYSVETLSPRDRYNEYIMTGLRTSDGIRREVLTSRFGAQALIYFEYMAGKLLQSGALVREGDTYRIPPERFMVSNDIISELFYVDE